MSIESREPEPQELVDRLVRASKRKIEVYDRELRRVVKEAESLTPAHQRAVSQYVAEQAGLAAGEPHTVVKTVGHAWHTYQDVVIELAMRIDDQVYVARDTVGGFTWEMDFKTRIDEWEQYLNYFTRRAVGSLSQDPEQFARFRRKLFVVTPQDRHDARLCRASNDTGLNQDLWPRCLSGVVRRALPVSLCAFIETDNSEPQIPVLASPYRDGRALGKCRCRCHLHPLADVCDPEYRSRYLGPYDDRLFVA